MNSKKILLSFIVPCYNVEAYLQDCLNSLYNQDIAESSFEIICINDCSIDNTKYIITQNKTKHTNLLYINNITNLGPSQTRNIGLQMAKGKYIWFIDSDDFIKQNCLSYLLSILEYNQLDILNFNMLEYNVFKSSPINPIHFINEETTNTITGKSWLQFLDNCNMNSSVNRKIFRRDYLITNIFLFTDEKIYEDEMYSLRTTYYAQRFMHINSFFYFYRANPASTSNKTFTVQNYLSLIDVAIKSLDFSIKIQKEDPSFSNKIQYDISLEHLEFALSEIFFFNYSQRSWMLHQIKPYLALLQKSHYFNGINKLFIDNFYITNIILFVISPILGINRLITFKANLLIRKIRTLLKLIINKALEFNKSINHPALGIIWCLHRVLPEKSTFHENQELEVSPEFFESLIIQYQSAGYKFVPLDEIVSTKLHQYRYPWQHKFIHITFDDGFEDIYQYAFPILKKYNIPFTIYLSTDIIDNKALVWWLSLEKIILTNDEIYLADDTMYYCKTKTTKKETFTVLLQAIFNSAETPSVVFQRLFSSYQTYFETGYNQTLTDIEIKEMIDSGLCTIGAHAVSHPILTKLDTEQCNYEIYHSKKILKERFGVPVEHFSYPYSFWNEQVKECVNQAGYRTAVLGYGGSCRYKACDLLKMPRINITEKTK